MIPRRYRLKKDRDFDILFEKGEYVSRELTGVKFLNIEQADIVEYSDTDLKVAFVVSTKVSKKAVERNRKKRQMREVLKNFLDQNKIKKGYIFAVIARKKILDKDYKDIKLDIEQNLIKAGLLNENSQKNNTNT